MSAIEPEFTVRSLLDNEAFAQQGFQIAYPIAGAITKYLIDTFGKGKYLALYQYTEEDYEDIFTSIFKESLIAIENTFWLNMRAVNFCSAVLEEMLKAEGFL